MNTPSKWPSRPESLRVSTATRNRLMRRCYVAGDARSIEEAMEAEVVRMMDAADVLDLLREARKHLDEHNHEYHHVTPATLLADIDKALEAFR
jgi:hypothetical protein